MFPDWYRSRLLRLIASGVLSLIASLSLVNQLLADEASGENPPPTFYQDVLPLLKKNCVACHHARLAEGGLNLEALEGLHKGGDSGSLFDPANLDESLLIGRIDGSVGDIMPPEDNGVGAVPLNEAEIGKIKAWIQAGMPEGTPTASEAGLAWQDLPPSLRAVYTLSASPDGSLLAVGRGNTLAIVDAATGKTLQTLSDPSLASVLGTETSSQPPAHLDFVNSTAFDPTGNRIASGGFRTLKLWQKNSLPKLTDTTLAAATEQQRNQLLDTVLATIAAPQAKFIANDPAGKLDGIDLGGQAITQFFAAADQPWGFVVTADGKARIVNVPAKTILCELQLAGDIKHQQSRMELAATRQKQQAEFIAGLIPPSEEAVKKEEESLAKVQKTQEEKTAELETKKTELANAETELKVAQEATEPATEQAKLDELTKKRDEAVKNKEAAEAALVAANQALAAATDARDQSQSALEALRQELVAEQQRQAELEMQVSTFIAANPPLAITAVSIEVNEQGSGRAMVATAANGCRVCSTPDGRLLQVLTGAPENISNIIGVNETDLLAVGKTSEGEGAGLKWALWQAGDSWTLEQAIGDATGESPFSDRVTAIDFSPDGRWAVVGSGEPSRVGEVYVIDLETKTIHTVWDRLHSDAVLAIAFSPDGRMLATAGADRQIRVVDFPSGENVRSLEGHTHHVLGLAWQDHGRRLASASADNTVKLWDVRNNQAERTITIGNKELAGVEFIGTTSQIAVCTGGGVVSLYNADNGGHIRNYQGVSGFQMAITAAANGQWFAAGGDTGVVRVWPTDKDQPLLAWPPTE